MKLEALRVQFRLPASVVWTHIGPNRFEHEQRSWTEEEFREAWREIEAAVDLLRAKPTPLFIAGPKAPAHEVDGVIGPGVFISGRVTTTDWTK